jgi:hypothetical protein
MNLWGSFRAVRPVLTSRASTRWGLMVMSVRVVRIIEFDLNGRKLTLDWALGAQGATSVAHAAARTGGEADSSGYTLGTLAFRLLASSSSIRSGGGGGKPFVPQPA